MPSRIKKYLPSLLILAVIPIAAFASGGGDDEGTIEKMARLVLQLGTIVIISRLIGLLFQKVKLPFPSVLIEVLAGVLIGPHLLGGSPLPGFPHGIFPVASENFPISPELYGIATIASIIMLFSVGLETDLALLLKFSVVGLIVGVGGVLASFFGGAVTTATFFGVPFMTPGVLFLGVICTATSVGATARILSEKRKMDSPEGVTILAGAVIDDVLGIITLTIVTSVIASMSLSGMEAGATTNSVWVVTKAILVWLGFTVAGILFAGPLARLLKKFKSVTYIAILALGLALILGGIFEMAGLAMIIGAYVVGLSLSKTDLTDTVRDSLELLHSFFVPAFFIIMGMLVNPHAFLSKEVLLFGAIFTLVAILAKIIGCGAPTLFMNFNHVGALRVGVGMVPRGEVSLIIAGIGLSSGILDQKLFGAGIMMTILADFISLPFVAMLLSSAKIGTKKAFLVRNSTTTPIDFASSELTELVELRVSQTFRAEGFYLHAIVLDGHPVYHLRKNDTMITLHRRETGLEFESDEKDVMFIKTIVYEALLQLNGIISNVKDVIKPESLLKDLTNSTWRAESGIKSALSEGSIIPTLKAKTKQEVVQELIDILHSEGILKDTEAAVKTVMEREASMSTGMHYGIALPHGRTDSVTNVTIAVGLAPNGIDYQSLDGEPSKIFVLILSPLSSESSHIQVLANVSALLNSPEMREKLLRCNRQEDIYKFFKAGLGN